MGSTVFEIVPVLSDSAAAGSWETGLQWNPLGCNVCTLKLNVFVSYNTDFYSECLRRLWTGCIQRLTFKLKNKILFVHWKQSLYHSPQSHYFQMWHRTKCHRLKQFFKNIFHCIKNYLASNIRQTGKANTEL